MKKSVLSWRRALGLTLIALALAGIASLLLRPDGLSPRAGGQPTPAGSGPISPLPVRTSVVAPPTPGTVEETLAPGPTGPTVAAALDKPVVLSGNVHVSVVSVTASTVEAVGPGDPSGAALVVRVRLDNTSESAVDVDGAEVKLLYERGTEIGIPTPGGSRPFVGRLEEKKSVEGTYVFAVPDTSQKNVTVLVTYAAGAPVAKFDGAVN